MIKKEIWRPVVDLDYGNLYEVSNLGRVKSLDRIVLIKGKSREAYNRKRKGKILVLRENMNSKHIYIDLHKSVAGKRVKKTSYVHKLVAKAFIDNKENKSLIIHLDGDRTNNKSDNLKWSTQEELTKHKHKIRDAKRDGKKEN